MTSTTDGVQSHPRAKLIAAAPGQEPILDGLMQPYARELSAFHEVNFDATGKFVYGPLALFWSEPGRLPFLVEVDGEIAGLALVRSASDDSAGTVSWDMAEFFILHSFRRRGVGTEIAHAAWRRFAGKWEVRVIETNRAACEFWDKAIAAFVREYACEQRLDENGKRWKVFLFESSGS